MKYIFCSTFFTDIDENLKNTKSPMAVSGHKFQYGILKGLIENQRKVSVINIPRIRYFPNYPRIIFRKSSYNSYKCEYGVNIGFVNLPFLNYWTQYRSLYREICRTVKAENSADQLALICFNPTISQLLAMLKAKKKYKNLLLIASVGDLHGKKGLFIPSRARGISGKIRMWLENKQDELVSRYDRFALLTDAMSDALGVSDKPVVVVDGFFYRAASELPPVSNTDDEIKNIFYAGALEDEYGIGHLLRAFEKITDAHVKLTIAGSGGAEDEVRAFCKRDSRVTYLGVISPDEVEQYQNKATVLVNPRTSENEFVRYSFPSKNMECLASGRPYVAHRLPSYSAAYDKIIFYPENESDGALADKLIEVCMLPVDKRNEAGRNARSFILQEKNPKKQCEKIAAMAES